MLELVAIQLVVLILVSLIDPDFLITMPPKQIVIGGGYAGEMTDELEQLTQQLEGMTLQQLTPVEQDIQRQIDELNVKKQFVKDRRAQINQEQTQAAAKAKAQAKADATAQALANRKAGEVQVLTCAMSNMTIQTITIAKSKTVGKLKSKVVRRSGQYPTYGKKNGLKKDDLLAILPNGQVLPPRKGIYNIEELCGADPRMVVIENANYNPATFQFPVFNRQADEVVEEADDDVDESSDED